MLLFLLLVLGTISSCLGFDPSLYNHKQNLTPQYEVHWKVDEPKGLIYLALHVKTTGWVGFGIGESTSGSMPGADIVMGSVVDGKASITDSWASDYSFPNADSCQDWTLVSGEESDGYTTLELKRKLDTKDAQDRPIIAGPIRVVAAWGENNKDKIGYHFANRLTSEITFYGNNPVPILPAGAQYADLRMPNYTVPNYETNYICKSFPLPVDKNYSIIQIDPLVDPENIAHVHHFVAHICKYKEGGMVAEFSTAGDCFSPMGDPDSGCDEILTAWAAGGGPVVLPDEAGFPMGAGELSAKYIILQIHYNNPTGVGGYSDNSGIRIWYTPNLRKYDAAIFILGDAGLNFPPIPALSMTEYESECPSQCTDTLPYDVKIWQSFPHMHQVGTEMWTTHWRDGKQIGEIGRIEYWAFEHQQSEFVNVTVKPGDRLNTHCIYDTRNKDTITHFDVASTDEMCMHFIGYYPRVVTPTTGQWFACSYVDANRTVCGEWDVMEYPNPTIRDPPGGGIRRFGQSGTCSKPEEETKTDNGTRGSGGLNMGAQAAISALVLLVVFVLGAMFGMYAMKKRLAKMSAYNKMQEESDSAL